MSEQKTLRYGLVGCGRISGKHLQGIAQADGAELAAVCDCKPTALAAAMAASPGVRQYASYTAMLRDPAIDIVSICTPSGLHAEMALAAAAAGKHALIEKPMAMNSRDARRVMQAFRKAGKTVAVVLQNRFNAPVVHLRSLGPTLGLLRCISANVFWYRPQSYYEDEWHGTRAMDGGVLMNQGTHYVDIVLHLAGKPVASVSAFGGTLGHVMEMEDTVTVNVRFTDGTVGNIQANTISTPENFEGSVTLFYEHATVKIAGTGLNTIVYWKGRGEETLETTRPEIISDIYGNHHGTVIRHVTDAILHGQPLVLTATEGYKSLALIEAAYRSLQTGRIVHLGRKV